MAVGVWVVDQELVPVEAEVRVPAVAVEHRLAEFPAAVGIWLVVVEHHLPVGLLEVVAVVGAWLVVAERLAAEELLAAGEVVAEAHLPQEPGKLPHRHISLFSRQVRCQPHKLFRSWHMQRKLPFRPLLIFQPKISGIPIRTQTASSTWVLPYCGLPTQLKISNLTGHKLQ